MKHHMRTLSGSLAFFFIVMNAFAQKPIDLSKPVSESVKPTGIYWTFDDGTIDESFPMEVEDHSGNGYEGQLYAGKTRPMPVYTQGRFGTGLRFLPPPSPQDAKPPPQNPRVEWSLARTPGAWNETKLDMNNQNFTAGTWIKFEAANLDERQVIFLMLRGSQSNHWGFLLIKEKNQWKMRVNGAKYSKNINDIEDGNWHHLAFSWEIAEGTNVITYWCDGQIVGEPVEYSQSILLPSKAAERTFIVGERNVAHYSNGFVGVLDDIFVTTGVHTFQSFSP